MGVGFVALLLFGLANAACAQREDPMVTLQQAVSVALEKNPEHKMAAADIRVAAAGVTEARAGLLPRASFSETATEGNQNRYDSGLITITGLLAAEGAARRSEAIIGKRCTSYVG